MSRKDIDKVADIAEEYDRFMSAKKFEIVTGDVYIKDLLNNICRRPELLPLIDDIKYRIIDSYEYPFIVRDDVYIDLASPSIIEPSLGAVYIRHALEIMIWQRMGHMDGEPVKQIIAAILSCHTAISYHQGLNSREVDASIAIMPQWLKLLVNNELLQRDNKTPGATCAYLISQQLSDLLPLQGVSPDKTMALIKHKELVQEAVLAAASLINLAHPCERLLSIGGDNRLLVSEKTGLNQYGCSPRPRPWAITFSSCTASSISDIGCHLAEEFRQSLFKESVFNADSDCLYNAAAEIRKELANILTVEDAEIILTPSGTDGELYAAYFSLLGNEKGILNVLVAPNEIGSGTVYAANGLHFDSITPLGSKVKQGAPIESLPSDKIKVEYLDVRYDNGDVIPFEVLEKRLQVMVKGPLSNGRNVLIHLLDSSKTGLGAPSAESMLSLKRQYGDSLNIVVDAAQMRIGRDMLKLYVEAGFMIMVTGSKFFTGAPFAGALIVPQQIARNVDQINSMPSGLSDYSTRYDLPSRWMMKTQSLCQTPNLGLLLRWRAALWEIKAFYSVEPDEIFKTIKDFGEKIKIMITDSVYLDFVDAPTTSRFTTDIHNRWDTLPSIFSFLVKKTTENGDKVALTYDEARLAYKWLNSDIGGFLSSNATIEERNIAAIRCHIGQPVKINKKKNEWIAALRIAIGARLVSGVHFDPMLGDGYQERFDEELRGVSTVFRKLEIIGKYWARLDDTVIDENIRKDTHAYVY